MADLRAAFDYASKNPDSPFAKNLEQLAGSGSLDVEAKKLGLDLTPFKPKPEAGIVDKAKAVVGGASEGLGANLPLIGIQWAGRKLIENLPDTATFAGLTKAQMLDNLDKSPDLQTKFETMMGKEKAPGAYKVGEIAGTIAGLAVPAIEGTKALAATKTGGAVLDAVGKPFQAVHDFTVGTKDKVTAQATKAFEKAKAANPFASVDKVTELNATPEVSSFVTQAPENSKVVVDAVKQGVPDKDIKWLSTIQENEKPALQEMFNLAKKGSVDKEAEMLGKRPMDVVGENVLKPLKDIQKVNEDSMMAVNTTARALAGTPVDASAVGTTAKTALEKAGVVIRDPEEYAKAGQMAVIDGKPTPSRFNFDESVFKKLPAVQKQLSNALSDLPEGQIDAYDLHKFKKSLDQIIEFSKTSDKPITREAQSVLKQIRHSADSVLDSNFAAYNEANTTFKNTNDFLEKAHEVLGGKLDFLSSSADKAVGSKMRGLFSENASRQKLFDLLSSTEKVAAEHGIEVGASPARQAIMGNILEDLFGPPAVTGFKGSITKAVDAVGKGVKLVKNPVMGGLDIAGDALQKMQNISPEEKAKAVEAFFTALKAVPK